MKSITYTRFIVDVYQTVNFTKLYNHLSIAHFLHTTEIQHEDHDSNTWRLDLA